jgi:Bacterial Ig-like domain (group 2)/Abnormal spindle-like microcephaly-assoc'd, ASPM-SPD-2-Hydin/Galactose oxidase, central domain/Kelch motif
MFRRSLLSFCFASLAVVSAFAQSVTVTPTSIAFGNQAVGSTSAVHKVTLKNGQTSAITITSIATNLADYAETNTCPASLKAGASCGISVTFSPTVQGARNATLTVTDSGLSSPQTVSLTGTGTGPTLQSIAVTPASPTISVGSTQQFTATGTYSDGSTQNITTTVSWISATKTVATIGLHTGLANAVAAGSTSISANLGTVHGSTTLTVGSTAVLQSITVTPTVSIAAGTTQQFTATGHFSDGSTQNITTTSTWSSSNTAVATVSNASGSQGLATAVASGTASITAASGSISGSATLTVTPAVLVSITISPPSPTITAGSTQQFTATGKFSDNSTQNITTSVTWNSDTQSVATISNAAGSQGLATAVAAGSATISASENSISSSTQLTVSSSAQQAWSLHGAPGRKSHSAVWDPVSQQMIIFGGQQASTNTSLNDVWLGVTTTSQSDSFIAETPSGQAPPARFGHVATFDSVNNRMTVFGGNSGSCANDVWVLTGANGQSGTPAWISVIPSGAKPSGRVNAGGSYDPNTNSLIVFGGSNCTGQFLNDAWVLSNANGIGGTATWTQLSPSGTAPQPRESGSAVYDSTHNVLIVYAGDAGGSPFSDVWTLSNANGSGGTPIWSPQSPTGTSPAARTGQSAVFDSTNNRMVVFGGTTATTTFADTWVLTTANGIGGTPAWSLISVQGTAPSVAYHSAVYDAARNDMYVFAGASSQDKLQANDHAFALNGANGIGTGQKWTLGGPPVRYSNVAFYDASTDSLIVFGGQHAISSVNFNDYWKDASALGSANIQWALQSVTGGRPTPRWGMSGLYDSANNRLMIFGGATGFPAPCVSDYFVVQTANAHGASPNFVAITPTGTGPSARTRHVAAYASATNTMIVFGGFDCTSTYFNDVWILSNANDLGGTPAWTKLSPAGTAPSARESSSAIYDASTNSLVVYGGDAGSAPFGDIWILSHADGSGGTPAWTKLNPSNNGPVARSGQSATYDGQNNIMTIYGGFDGTNVLSDTWVLTGANGQAGSALWTQLPAGQPRRFHSSEFDPVTDQMITFGGASGISPQAPSAEIFTLTDANNVP